MLLWLISFSFWIGMYQKKFENHTFKLAFFWLVALHKHKIWTVGGLSFWGPGLSWLY